MNRPLTLRATPSSALLILESPSCCYLLNSDGRPYRLLYCVVERLYERINCWTTFVGSLGGGGPGKLLTKTPVGQIYCPAVPMTTVTVITTQTSHDPMPPTLLDV